MQRLFLHLILLIQVPLVFSQNSTLNQFYYSDHSPAELNETIDQRFDKIYQRYIQRYGKDKNIDAKTFVSNYNYFLDNLNRSGKIFYGDEISIYLNNLKDFILSGNDMKSEITVYLTDFPYLNAFTNDFGNIYVNVGTLAKLNSEEELIYLLAHEISHILLRHSHKSILFENDSKSSKNKLNEHAFRRHEFSREQEFEADQNAFELLKNRVDAQFDLRLLHLLDVASNPVFPGEVNLSLLWGENVSINQNLIKLYSEDTLSRVLYLVSGNDTLSTHPSAEKRIAKLESLLQSYTPPSPAYQAIKNFSEIKLLASYVLISSFIDSEQYIEALDQILKMRSKYGDSSFLIEKQINALTLLSFSKYTYDYFDLILNNSGNSCIDTDFLRFRKLILSLRNADFVTLALNNIESLIEKESQPNPKSALALKKLYQEFYQQNDPVFELNSSSESYHYTPQNLTLIKEEGILSKKLHENDLLSELLDKGYHSVTKKDSLYFLQFFIADSSIEEKYQGFIENYKNTVLKNRKTVDFWREILTPASAAYKYNKGDFEQSTDFDIKNKSLIIQSDYVYFKSRNKRDFKLDHTKNQELESKMIQFKRTYNPDQLDFTNRFGTKNTVYSNYLHKILFDWMMTKSKDGLSFSSVEYEALDYLKKENIRYIVYNICIVNRNKGRGRSNYSNYYEFYFDVDKEEIVYSTKIGTRLNPSVYTLENLIYVTEYHKNSKSK